MPADVIEHAFEPSYTARPDGTGTGLGLATVYGIVTQTGGTTDIYLPDPGHRPARRAAPAARSA
jgi:two-component system cell cycle sensor histidine kinase/response regulator CckA